MEVTIVNKINVVDQNDTVCKGCILWKKQSPVIFKDFSVTCSGLSFSTDYPATVKATSTIYDSNDLFNAVVDIIQNPRITNCAPYNPQVE